MFDYCGIFKEGTEVKFIKLLSLFVNKITEKMINNFL